MIFRSKQALKSNRDIGRFLVDSSPAVWMILEVCLVFFLFDYFASFGKAYSLLEIRLLNKKGAMIFSACFSILSLGLGLYERENRFSRLNSLQLISLSWILSTPLSLFLLYLISFEKVGRWSLALGSFGSVVIVYFLIHWFGAKLLKRYPHRFFYLGERSQVASILFAEIRKPEFVHFKHMDEIDFDIVSQSSHAELDRFVKNLCENRISVVVVSWEKRFTNDYSDFIFACLSRGIRVVEDVEYYCQMTRRIPVEALPSSYVLKMGFDVHSPIGGMLKRFLDVFISASLLFFGLPFFLITAILIRVESKGEVLYFQKRISRFGKEFKLAKFRTMCVNAEAVSYVTERKDSRITRIGSVLRILHFDELPQLWNVLKGDMSLVGPRPQPTQMVEDISGSVPLFKLRHILRPGLTGLAQISQGKTTDEVDEMSQKLSYDLYYIKNYNIFLDLWIMSRTLSRMIQSTW